MMTHMYHQLSYNNTASWVVAARHGNLKKRGVNAHKHLLVEQCANNTDRR